MSSGSHPNHTHKRKKSMYGRKQGNGGTRAWPPPEARSRLEPPHWRLILSLQHLRENTSPRGDLSSPVNVAQVEFHQASRRWKRPQARRPRGSWYRPSPPELTAVRRCPSSTWNLERIWRQTSLISFMHCDVCRLDPPRKKRRIKQRRRKTIIPELVFHGA